MEGAFAYLLLLEVRPLLLVVDHEPGGSLWVRHLCGSVFLWYEVKLIVLLLGDGEVGM